VYGAEAVSQGLVGKARGAEPACRGPFTTRPVWSRSGQSTRAFPHIRGAQVVFNERSGADRPAFTQRRLAPHCVRERCFGLRTRAPRVKGHNAECRRGPAPSQNPSAAFEKPPETGRTRTGFPGPSPRRNPGSSRIEGGSLAQRLSGAPRPFDALWPRTRGATRAEAKAPFLNAGGRKAPLNQGGAAAPLHSLENDLRPLDVKERPGCLGRSLSTPSRRGPSAAPPPRPRGPHLPSPRDCFGPLHNGPAASQ